MHRTIWKSWKPSNFLIDFDADEPKFENIKVYLTDFGLVGDKSGGTPGFVSPECISGTSNITKNW